MKICGIFIFITIAVIFSSMPCSKVAARTIRGGVCTANRNCPHTETCFENACIGVCVLKQQIQIWERCGANAFCYQKGNHTAGCKCNSGRKGDPYVTGCS